MPNIPKTYTPKEAAEIVGIKERAIQYRCKRDNVRKKDNKYLITDSLIALWFEKDKDSNAKRNNVTQLDLEVESLKIENEKLRAELKIFKISDNERIEVFTDSDYIIFEQRLKEWVTLQQDIENQQKVFDAESKGTAQVIEYYKNQFQYQKEQSARILEIHEKLIETVNAQNKITFQRNFIEAKEKGYDSV